MRLWKNEQEALLILVHFNEHFADKTQSNLSCDFVTCKHKEAVCGEIWSEQTVNNHIYFCDCGYIENFR